jgi:hypothetical protein
MNRQTRPSELTGAAIADLDIYLVRVLHHSAKGQTCYWIERDDAEANRASTVSDIASAQIDDVVTVIKFNAATFSCEDVTKEIAREVMAMALEANGDVPRYLMDFVEGALGCGTVATAERELVA